MDTLIHIATQLSVIHINKRIDKLVAAAFTTLDLVIIFPYNPILMYITTLMYITRSQMKIRTKKSIRNIKSRRKKLIMITNIGSTRILWYTKSLTEDVADLIVVMLSVPRGKYLIAERINCVVSIMVILVQSIVILFVTRQGRNWRVELEIYLIMEGHYIGWNMIMYWMDYD